MNRRIIHSLAFAAMVLMLGGIARAQDQKKFAYGILIDNTGSMRHQFELEINLGKALVRHVHEHGPVSVFDFRSEGVGPGMRALPVARIEGSQDERLLNRTLLTTCTLKAVKLLCSTRSKLFPIR